MITIASDFFDNLFLFIDSAIVLLKSTNDEPQRRQGRKGFLFTKKFFLCVLCALAV